MAAAHSKNACGGVTGSGPTLVAARAITCDSNRDDEPDVDDEPYYDVETLDDDGSTSWSAGI
jgi:hypothetical protein